MRLHCLSFAQFSIAIFLASSAASASTITYDLYSQSSGLQGGYSLTGQVVTDGTIGPLSSSDILSWHFSSSNGSSFGASSTDVPNGNLSAPQATVVNVSADATHLSLPDPGGFGLASYFELSGVGGTPALLYEYDGPNVSNSGVLGYKTFNFGLAWSSTPSTAVPDTWFIGTAVPTPEPSTAVLFAIGATLLGALTTLRRARTLSVRG